LVRRSNVPTLIASLLVLFALAGTRAAGREGTDALENSGSERTVLRALATRAVDKFAGVREGKLPSYIPALAESDPDRFAVAIATTRGEVFSAGDADVPFAIMSVAKVFTLALILEDLGTATVIDRIGVEPTGLPFNSIRAVEIHPERSVNPLVNAGALAAVSLLQGEDPAEKWLRLLTWYGRFAGRDLALLTPVYASVSATGERNRAMAHLLRSYGRLYADPDQTRDTYNRQSSVAVTARDLAIMGAALANGGVQPRTGERLITGEHVEDVLAIMMMAGMYDGAGRWAVEVGLPAKSGVGGGVLAIAPGQLAIAGFSPRLDENGNSVRAVRAIRWLAEELDLDLFGLPQAR
jgi:glutaminase